MIRKAFVVAAYFAASLGLNVAAYATLDARLAPALTSLVVIPAGVLVAAYVTERRFDG